MLAYETILPGSAERFLQMREQEINLAQKQVEHRMALEQKVIRGDNSRANWGMATGFIIALTGIGSSVVMILHGHDVAGSVFAGTTFVSLVGTFVYGTNSRKEERLKKTQLMLGHNLPESQDQQ